MEFVSLYTELCHTNHPNTCLYCLIVFFVCMQQPHQCLPVSFGCEPPFCWHLAVHHLCSWPRYLRHCHQQQRSLHVHSSNRTVCAMPRALLCARNAPIMPSPGCVRIPSHALPHVCCHLYCPTCVLRHVHPQEPRQPCSPHHTQGHRGQEGSAHCFTL